MATASPRSNKAALAGLLVLGVVHLVLLNFAVGPAYLRELAAAEATAASLVDVRSSATERPAAGTNARPPAPAEGPSEPIPPPLAASDRPAASAPVAPAPAVSLAANASAPLERASAAEAAPPPTRVVAAPPRAARPDVAPPARPSAVGAAVTVYFATRSSELDAAVRRELWRIGEQMLAHPETRATVIGHADERGDSGFNDWLANRRAQVVAAYLSSMGVRRDRLTVSGLGSSRPADSSGSLDAHSRNRRVEVQWTK